MPKHCALTLDEYSINDLNYTAGLGHIYREGPKDVLLTVVEDDPRGDLYLSRHEYEKAVTGFTWLGYYVVLLILHFLKDLGKLVGSPGVDDFEG